MAHFKRYLLRVGIAITFMTCASTAMCSGETEAKWSSSQQMSEAAKQWVATLSPEQKERAVFSVEAKERTAWSNLPIIMVEPGGIKLSEMTAEQRIAAHELLRASLSSQGYAKITGIMFLDDLLHQFGMERISKKDESEVNPVQQAFVNAYDSGFYAVAVFGDPGSSAWGWKVAGHHAAANFTVSNGRVGFTPTFLGSSPMVVDKGRYTGWSALPNEGRLGIELMQSLSEEQQKTAIILDEMPGDIFAGPGRRASLSSFEGLKADKLTTEQKRLLKALVSEYVRNGNFDAAEAQLELISKAGWNELWFSWHGPVGTGERFYYRVHGARLLIEYSRQDVNHDHMIIRDPKNDYGEDWLGKHYEEHHPTMEEAMDNARRAAGVTSE